MARGESLVRQWNILKAMQANRFGLSAGELAERVECSKRQILRDLKLLQEIGFPIDCEQRDYGKKFWKLSSQVIESDLLIFSLTEMISIYFSCKLLNPLTNTVFGEGLNTLLDKIRATITPQALEHFVQLDQTILVKSHIRNDYSSDDTLMRTILRAIEESLVIKLRYQSVSKTAPYETLYHPYGMLVDGEFYYIGFMEAYEEVRTIKLKRILGIELTDRTFTRPANFSLQSHTLNSFGVFSCDGPNQTVHIQLVGWAAAIVREGCHHPSQRILQDNKHGIIVEFKLADTTELTRWILGFGANARVLKPAQLARNIGKELEKMSVFYRSE